MLSVQQLRSPPPRQAVYSWGVTLLKAFGFQTTGWQKSRSQRAYLYLLSTAVADLAELGKSIVEFAFNDTSSGDPLNEFSKSRFDNTKTAATKTVGPMNLRNVGLSPYTVSPGQLLAATAQNVQFRNTTGGTVPAGSVLDPGVCDPPLVWEAVLAGSQGNVDTSSVDRLLTPLAGVTVKNDIIGGTTWYTTAGADEEGDGSIQQRNRTKWANLALSLVREGYEQVARANGAAKVYVVDSNPRGAGTVDVYVSGLRTLLGPAELDAIQLAFSKRWPRTYPWPGVSLDQTRVLARHATTQGLDLTGSFVYFDPAFGDVQAEVTQALLDLLDVCPLGGFDFSPGPTHVITRADIDDAIKNVEGVKTVVLGLTADVTIEAQKLVTPASDTFGLQCEPITS